MQLWRMRADGSVPEQLTSDQYNNWFPHLSPDGQWIAFLSFMKDVAPGDHPFYKHVYLRVMSTRAGGEARASSRMCTVGRGRSTCRPGRLTAGAGVREQYRPAAVAVVARWNDVGCAVPMSGRGVRVGRVGDGAGPGAGPKLLTLVRRAIRLRHYLVVH